MKDIASLLGSIGADTVSPGGGGSDIGPIMADGVPALSPRTVGEHYFDWHHTEADTLDKVDPDSFKKNTAMLSVVAYVLADMDGRLAGQKGSFASRPMPPRLFKWLSRMIRGSRFCLCASCRCLRCSWL